MSELTYIPVEEADAARLAEILSDAGQRKLGYSDNSWGNTPFTEKEALHLISLGPTYLIQSGDESAGTITLQWEDEGIWGEFPAEAGYIHRLAVKQQFAGQGIGKKAVNWAAAQAKTQSKDFLRLDCEAVNTELCAYYERQGFRQVGTKTTPGHDYLAALYERPIE